MDHVLNPQVNVHNLPHSQLRVVDILDVLAYLGELNHLDGEVTYVQGKERQEHQIGDILQVLY
jgi:hypothetical protein